MKRVTLSGGTLTRNVRNSKREKGRRRWRIRTHCSSRFIFLCNHRNFLKKIYLFKHFKKDWNIEIFKYFKYLESTAHLEEQRKSGHLMQLNKKIIEVEKDKNSFEEEKLKRYIKQAMISLQTMADENFLKD